MTTTMTMTTATGATMMTDTLRRPRHVKVALPVRHGTTYRRRLSRPVAVGAAVVVLLAGSGAAYAVLGGLSASGGGTATVRPLAALALTSAEASSALAPGGTATVEVTVPNPYPRPLVVQSLVAAGPTVLAPGGAVECDPATVSFSATIAPGAPESSVPAGSTGTFSGTMTMAADAPPECQGATFRVPVRIAARVS